MWVRPINPIGETQKKKKKKKANGQKGKLAKLHSSHSLSLSLSQSVSLYFLLRIKCRESTFSNSNPFLTQGKPNFGFFFPFVFLHTFYLFSTWKKKFWERSWDLTTVLRKTHFVFAPLYWNLKDFDSFWAEKRLLKWDFGGFPEALLFLVGFPFFFFGLWWIVKVSFFNEG